MGVWFGLSVLEYFCGELRIVLSLRDEGKGGGRGEEGWGRRGRWDGEEGEEEEKKEEKKKKEEDEEIWVWKRN